MRRLTDGYRDGCFALDCCLQEHWKLRPKEQVGCQLESQILKRLGYGEKPRLERDLGRVTRHWRRWLLLFVGVWGVDLTVADESFERTKAATFEAVWGYVNEAYYDADFGGKDWGAIGDRYRERLASATDEGAARQNLEAMLGELGESHFALLPGGRGAARRRSGGWWGGEIALVGDEALVYRVERDGPAWQAGLRDGDRIAGVGGLPLAELLAVGELGEGPAHLRRYERWQRASGLLGGGPGDVFGVEVLDAAGTSRLAELELERYRGRVTPGLGLMGPMPLAVETRRWEDGTAYLRFSVWFPVAMPEIREFVTGLGEECPGLVIDLRGNPGGIGVMAGGLAGLLVAEDVRLGTTRLRDGELNFVGFAQKGAYLGPVAALLDGGSASTSEIFAAGLQEAGRVRVFGQRSAGAALPSAFVSLPNGDVLQAVFGDFRTPGGVAVEGRGVAPDEEVALSVVAFSRGEDSVVESARRWLSGLERTEPLGLEDGLESNLR